MMRNDPLEKNFSAESNSDHTRRLFSAGKGIANCKIDDVKRRQTITIN